MPDSLGNLLPVFAEALQYCQQIDFLATRLVCRIVKIDKDPATIFSRNLRNNMDLFILFAIADIVDIYKVNFSVLANASRLVVFTRILVVDERIVVQTDNFTRYFGLRVIIFFKSSE